MPVKRLNKCKLVSGATYFINSGNVVLLSSAKMYAAKSRMAFLSSYIASLGTISFKRFTKLSELVSDANSWLKSKLYFSATL